MNEHVEEALRLIQAGHGVVEKISAAAPEDRDPYGKQAMGIWAQAQVHATLAVVDELKSLNSDRSQWYREVLEVLSAAKDGDVSSLRFEQPAAASDGKEGDEPRVCRVCGKPGVLVVCTEKDGPLTRKQWLKHHDDLYYESGKYGANKVNAAYWADSQMENRFGPCPEES